MDALTYTKGSRIRAAWFGCVPGLLAGSQLKVTARQFSLTGVVKHLRGDDPINPTTVRIYVDPDSDWDGPKTTPVGCKCGHPHVELKPEWVVGFARDVCPPLPQHEDT